MQNQHTHDHSHTRKNESAVGLAALLTGTFLIVEVVGGILSGSLALLADAGHMLTDFSSLLLAWFAFRLSHRPADWRRTYGYDRFSILAAFVNGLTLFAIAGWIVVEAVQRLMNPSEVVGHLMLGVAIAGLVVNVIAFLVLRRGESDNLNVRAAALHVMGDILGSVAAIVASVVILLTGWMPIDPLLSMLVAVLILRSGYAVVKDSGHILLEASPRDFDRRDVAQELQNVVPGVKKIEHFHIWSLTQERTMATLEAVLSPDANSEHAKEAIKRLLREKYGIGHVTIEITVQVSGGK